MPDSKVLVADDHPIIRRGLQLLISQAGDLKSEEVASVDDLLDRLRSEAVELLLLSGSFARDGGMLRRVKADFPRVPILIFDSQTDDSAPVRVLRAGASGFLDTLSSPEELFDAIRRLQRGGTFLSRVIAEGIAAGLARGEKAGKLHERLSPRELEVFRFLGAGKPVGEIARKLKVSVKTVSTHRTRILEKTGMRNNADIIRYTILNKLMI
jgi:two-component system invasion response regulator UvrY